MSKLVDAIASCNTGRVRPVNARVDPRLTVEAIEPTLYQWQRAHEYIIGLKFDARAWVTEKEMARDTKALASAIEEAKRALVECVFGEFRPMFRQLHRSIYEVAPSAELEEVRQQLFALETRMFEVGQ